MHKTVLKQVLDDNGLKQTWVAKRVGVTAPALNLIVHGKTLPTLRTAQRIARLLRTSVDDLWPLEEELPTAGVTRDADRARGSPTASGDG
ncbi:helix-turn-helix transcriptional regulator [Alicyclobacillus sp. ALC3]|uniref:helix-turn-helix transcriptional regulator n=1 Tax=Alicyclobacillus sp. ALC3 TaxID=2796143 RepID=UPI002379DADB|nr:helix-turn-helix domain-containing protein [Alicyclobacillus sp. ALC3]WDL98203.1 helix-turn-helix domain-containing protein [Alicyclobacillus sp. ALC3]